MRGAAAASAVHPRCPPAGFPPSPRPPIPLFRRAPKVTDRRGEGGTPRRGQPLSRSAAPWGCARLCSARLACNLGPPTPAKQQRGSRIACDPATTRHGVGQLVASLRCAVALLFLHLSGSRGFMASQGRRVSFSTTVARHRPGGQPPGGCPPWPLSPCSSWGTRQRCPAWSIGLLHRPFRIHPGQG